jgi:hypothetical protein
MSGSLEQLKPRGSQCLGLPLVAALVHHRVVGRLPEAADSASLGALLDDVARAISNVVPIYVSDPAGGLQRELSLLELINGKFARGAHIFITQSGDEIRGLLVQRSDMIIAIGVLRGAGVKFRRSDEPIRP